MSVAIQVCGAALCIIFLGTCSAKNTKILDLGGNDWLAESENKTTLQNANVPGSIYTELMRQGLIDDVYYRFNDDVYKWIAHQNWTYTKNISLGLIIEGYKKYDVIFEGVDTVAKLSVNGFLVTTMNNMFRKYELPVKKYLKVGTNEIKLEFQSPVAYAKAQSATYPYDVPPDCPGPEAHGECHVNFIRKEASSFSWDWGPSFPTIGIWKNARLVMYDKTGLQEFSVVVSLSGIKWTVKVNASFRVVEKSAGVLMAYIDYGHSTVGYGLNCNITEAHKFCDFAFQLALNDVHKWWPNGYGNQAGYNMTLSWQPYDNFSETGLLWKKIYFRSVELIQDDIPKAKGSRFYFKINGRPIFMKGSNWIPADSFQERISPGYLRKLLMSAKLANMNMLRVWGGGVYESDVFYDLADELGIMIWQDFMFACALYPTNDDFLQNVAEEVKHQVLRLRMHPSIVVWAGNNENEGALASNWYGVKPKDMPRYYKDYKILYLNTIEKIVEGLDPARPFVGSSPSNGQESTKEGGIAKNPQDEYYGDVHFYNYYIDSWNYSLFPTPRFASEFGYQSWCSLESLKPVSKEEDLTLNSSFVNHRQHHPQGNQQLIEEVRQHLNFTTTSDEQADFKHFVYLTQINQAVSIKTEAEHYRRMQSDIYEDGRGFTMGSLYWQLNDIWQAPTWASIEYGGKWKMLHYFARNFYSPVLISPARRPDDTIEVCLINDALLPFGSNKSPTTLKSRNFAEEYNQDVLKFIPKRLVENEKIGSFKKEAGKQRNLVMNMYLWSSMNPVKTWTIPLSEQTKAAEIVHLTNVKDVLSESKCPSVDHCFLYFGLDDCSATNWLLLSNFTTAQGLKKANVKATSVEVISPTSVRFTLTTDAIAPFVWLDFPGHQGYWSDNGFILVVPQIEVVFTSWEPILNQIAITPRSISIQSLLNW